MLQKIAILLRVLFLDVERSNGGVKEKKRVLCNKKTIFSNNINLTTDQICGTIKARFLERARFFTIGKDKLWQKIRGAPLSVTA